MQKFGIISIILLVIVIIEAGIIFCTVSNSKSAIDIIKERKSVRHFVENKQVQDKDIKIMLDAAMAAPSAANKQPWEFIVIKNRETLDKVAMDLPFGKFLKFAPLAIIVAGNMNRTLPDIERDYWVQDASAATENLLLAAEALGLGAVWTGVYPVPERVEALSKTLSLPENIIPLNVVIIGYPTGVDKAKNKYNEQYIHFEKF